MPQQALHEALLPLAATYAAQKTSSLIKAERKDKEEREEKEKGKGKKSIVAPTGDKGKGKGKGKEVGVVENGREGEGWNRRTNPFWGRCGDSSFVFSSSLPPLLSSISRQTTRNL